MEIEKQKEKNEINKYQLKLAKELRKQQFWIIYLLK